MDLQQKIQILGDSAKYDLCGSYLCASAPRARGPLGRWIYPAVMPDGKRILLFKVLMSNACENNCFYCANSCFRSFPQTSFQPEELARLFMDLHHRGLVQGLFLSSAVSEGVAGTSEKMLKTVEILRFRYQFPGYIHLKILPGASFDYVERAAQIASRVSVNIEAPSPERLAKIAKAKNFADDIILRMKWVKALQKHGIRPKAGQTTQFVVGAAEESDKEILQMTDWLYREVDLRRAYFSAFQPVENTPLENHPPTPLMREHRLYEVDFLLRHYGFKFEEIVFDEQGNLPLEADPKLVWALHHPERFPVEINKAEKEELLRVPGIGPKSAKKILEERRKNKFYRLEDLKGVIAAIKRAAPFILVNGRLPIPATKKSHDCRGCFTPLKPAQLRLGI